MKNYIRSIRIFLILALLLFPIATNGATVPTVTSADRDYNANKYRDAAEKYQKIVDSMTVKSETQKKELLRCQYNLARSLDKSGQFSKAKGFYLTVAGSSDEKLALQAKYDLACLYIQMANQSAGKNPTELDKDARLSIEEDVNSAIELFRVILELKPEYPEIHDKMERALATLNVWKKAWADADFKKEVEPKKALEFAVEVENDILNANSKMNRLGLKADSYNMRQDFYQEAEQVSDLTRKLPIVQEKAFRFLSGQEPQEVPGQNGQPGTVVQQPAPQLTPEQQAQLAQVKPVIESWVKESQEKLEQSATALYNRDVTKADEVQKKALQSLDNLYLVISPLDETIKRAIEQQKAVIKSTEARIKEQKPSDETAQPDKADKKTDELKKLEQSEEAFKEEMMLPWTAIIVPKAKAMLSQLPPEKKAKKKSKKSDDSEDDSEKDSKLTLKEKVKDTANSLQDALDAFQNPQDEAVDTQSANPQDQQIQKVRKMCKKAVELGPKIPELVQKATKDMKAEKWDSALESQKEALRLLEEIIKDDSQQNQQNQDNQNQDNKDQQQKDQQNQDKNKQDKNNQNQDKQQDKQDQKSEQDKQKEEQDKQKEQEEQQKQEEKDAQEQEAERKKAQVKEEEMTDSEARGLMRRVQARHDEQKKLEKEVQRRLNPPEKVEKDW